MGLIYDIRNTNWGAIFVLASVVFLIVLVTYFIYLGNIIDPYVLVSCEVENGETFCFYKSYYNATDVKVIKEVKEMFNK